MYRMCFENNVFMVPGLVVDAEACSNSRNSGNQFASNAYTQPVLVRSSMHLVHWTNDAACCKKNGTTAG